MKLVRKAFLVGIRGYSSFTGIDTAVEEVCLTLDQLVEASENQLNQYTWVNVWNCLRLARLVVDEMVGL